MTSNRNVHPKAQKPPQRKWVLRCTPESIAAGKISVLALVEVLAAAGLYWWLVPHFEWPWLVLVAPVAAPLLLLRSPESISLGVGMIPLSIDDLSPRASRSVFCWRNFLAVAISFVFPMSLFFYGAQRFSTSHIKIVLYCASWLLPTEWMVLLVMVTLSRNVFLIYADVVFWKPRDRSTSPSVFRGVLAMLTLGVPIALAYWGRSVLVQLVATIRNLKSGLAHLPQNWRETLTVIDFTHPPELLPGVGRADPLLTFAGYWKSLAGATAAEWALAGPVLVAWYAPSLVYRWSLKASAWLWWPLALALAHPLEGLGEQETRERTSKSVKGAWRWTLIAPAIVFVWLLLSIFPFLVSWLEALPKEVSIPAIKLLALAPPPERIRFVFCLVSCALAYLFWHLSRNFAATHDKVLGSTREWNDLTVDDKDRFMALARRIEKVRLLFITALLGLGYAYAVSFAQQLAPQLVERLLVPWLAKWL